MTPSTLIFSLFFLSAPNAPESTWVLNSQYRTELSCNMIGAMKQAQLKKMGLTLTYVCQPGQR